MSKAFTSDSDEGQDLPEAPPPAPGTRYYMTLKGAQRLRSEQDALLQEHRKLGTGIEDESRKHMIERRLRFLAPRLEIVEPIDPMKQPKDQVRFGAQVTLHEAGQPPQTWRIVGVDEADLDRGWIGWTSPLAGALLDHRVGDSLRFMNRTLTIQAIRYSAM